ncbi:MAG: Nramp family divalent metal transporter [Holophagales bacterium]|nr:MAG: Nramp family divalent metal transporter [Holophagales bacterium]
MSKNLAPVEVSSSRVGNREGGLSLPEVHGSVSVSGAKGWLRRFLAFAGPGYLVSVGYMDPGNWATDLAGGAQFGYALIWVILLSNLMAIFLQTLCARLGVVTGRDLAQACREQYSKPVAYVLWVLCEIAIIACDLAEVIGSAVALNLLFGLPLVWGVLITGFDVMLLLAAMHFGFRKIEAIVLTLVSTVALCFALQVFLSSPDWGGVAMGMFVPTLPGREAFYIALGILGATVMPHNLYLHTALVQTRDVAPTSAGRRLAIRYNTTDTVIALGAAFFVNAAILIVAAAVFHRAGLHHVSELQEAHRLLAPLLGAPIAATAFAVALLASGQSSTITGTLAGQIVMEGFLRIRIRPWLRRLITRLLAIGPAVLLISASGGKETVELLVFSQVVLSMQLSFATFPLMKFTSDRALMGEFVNPRWVKILGYGICTLIAVLNLALLFQTLGWIWMALVAAVAAGFAIWVRWFYRGE